MPHALQICQRRYRLSNLFIEISRPIKRPRRLIRQAASVHPLPPQQAGSRHPSHIPANTNPQGSFACHLLCPNAQSPIASLHMRRTPAPQHAPCRIPTSMPRDSCTTPAPRSARQPCCIAADTTCTACSQPFSSLPSKPPALSVLSIGGVDASRSRMIRMLTMLPSLSANAPTSASIS